MTFSAEPASSPARLGPAITAPQTERPGTTGTALIDQRAKVLILSSDGLVEGFHAGGLDGRIHKQFADAWIPPTTASNATHGHSSGDRLAAIGDSSSTVSSGDREHGSG